MTMNRCFILFFIVSLNYCYGQKEHNVWHFGCEAGIDFNGPIPIPLTNGALCTNEGSSSICDYNGDLLFYTDGMNVWNKNHIIMPNGSGLSGGSSSTQSSLIIKRPGFIDKYYIFTTAHEAGPNGLRYSEVDMKLGCGTGDIGSNKDILITTPVCEKITAILHQNGRDFWIITRIHNTDEFHSYLLTSLGLEMTPVISNIGNIVTSFGWTGYLRGSNDGSKIVSVIGHTDTVQVFNFDKSTGLLSNEITLNNFSNPNYGAYGAEFSPNNNLLYVAESGPQNQNFIYQYNLLEETSLLINNTRTTIGSNSGFQTGALQLAYDGKIYHTIWGKDTLAVIENPDSIGLLCTYLNNGFYLGGKYAYGGLPNRPNALANISFYALNLCVGNSTFFSINSQNPLDSVFWDFGDPNSDYDNYSNLLNPSHQFSDTGMYSVNLVIYSNQTADTIQNFIIINDLPNVDLGDDTTLCSGQTLILEFQSECSNMIWQDGSNSSNYEITQPGIYSVEVNENGCIARDTIMINYTELPEINLGSDTTLCNEDVLNLGPISGTSYYWQDNSYDSIYTVTYEGLYYVVVFNEQCTSTDSIFVKYINCDNFFLIVPNVFTPNGDNINDLFFIKLPHNIEFIELLIINRWGNEVFKTKNPNSVWDGENSSDGVYFWVLYYRTEQGIETKKSGFVHLFR